MTNYTAEQVKSIANKACRYDTSRYQPWSDSKSPHYGDAEHFVRNVLREVALLRERESVKEAIPNDDTGADAAIKHHVFVYEVDFGDEGKGRYVRLNDFNRVVNSLEAERENAPIVTLSRADVDAWNLPESWTGKRVQLVEAKP